MDMFKAKPTTKETVREAGRGITKGVREIERELMGLKREEEKLIREIKAAAKANNTAAMRVLAKSLVRLRGQMTTLQSSAAQLKGVKHNITTAAATATVASAVGQASKAMGAMQQQLNPAKMQQQLAAFAKENEKLDMVGEMVGDTLDAALDGEDAEEETGELVGQVLDEIGIDLSAMLAGTSAPTRKVAAAAPAEKEGSLDDDMLARLAQLKS